MVQRFTDFSSIKFSGKSFDLIKRANRLNRLGFMLLTKCVRMMTTTMTMKASTLSIQSRDFMAEHPIFHHLLLGEESCNNLRIDLKTLHAYSITSGFIKDNFIASRIIQFFLRNSSNYAHTLFNSIDEPDVYTWNAMIIGRSDHGISYYFQMRQRSLPPNNYTFALLIKCCIIMVKSGFCLGSTALLCREIHGQVLKHGVEDLVVVKNSLIQMYTKMGCLIEARLLFESSLNLDLISWNSMISAFGKNGDMKVAREMFDKMPERNLVSWSAMIDGYVRNDEFAEALGLFDQMLVLSGSSVKLDIIVLVSVLKACANMGALDLGKWVRSYIDRNNLQKNLVLGTALVDMYAKCGCIDVALELFNEISTKDVILWNSMIGGLALHGHGREALRLFNSMKSSGTLPNGTTFVTVLCACAHVGMVNEGVQIFRSMKDEYRIEPEVEHYGCLADILGRAGLVTEAEEVLINMPMEPQASQLGALMAACRTHNNIEVGERVGKRLISMEPRDGGRYVLLSNIYASAGRWEDARDTRKEMDQMGAKKVTGCSFMELDGVVHEFVVGDTRHPQSKEIYGMLGDTQREMKMVALQ